MTTDQLEFIKIKNFGSEKNSKVCKNKLEVGENIWKEHIKQRISI